MSDHILYKSSSLSEAAAELNRLMDTLDDVAAGLARVDTSAEWWLKVGSMTLAGRRDARSTMELLRKKAGRVQNYVSETTNGVRRTQALFDDAERRVSAEIDAVCTGKGFVQNAGGATSGSSGTNTEKQGWFDSLSDAFRSAIDQMKDGIRAGYGAIVRNLKDCKAYWVDNWNNKGWLYKAVKATGAVLSIVGSAAVITSAIGAAVASGAGIPIAVAALVGIYSGNSILNSAVDLYNIFGGDINRVGQTNLLKSGAKWVFGGLGGLVGYREAGEKVGEIVYTVGSVASTVLTLRQLVGKVIQTDSLELGNSVQSAASAIKQAWTQNGSATIEEARIGLEGLVHIATKVPVSEVGLQLSLLKGHLSALEGTVKGMKLLSVLKQTDMISEAVGAATKIINAGVDVANLSYETWVSTAYKGRESEAPDWRILRSDEAIDHAVETITGKPKSDTSFVDDVKNMDVYKGKENIESIVETIRNMMRFQEYKSKART